MILSASQIADYARRAGFPESLIPTMTAISLAESGGNPSSRLFTSREDSRGLWQINIKAHPEFAAYDLTNPQANADAAYAVWKKQGLNAWTTYTTGAYKSFLGAVGSVGSAISGAVSGVFHSVPVSKSTTTTIIYVTATIVLFLVGVRMLR